MIEMFMVIVLVAVLSAVAFGKYHKGASARAASGARDTFVWLGRRARALAVQKGQIVRLTINPTTTRARLWLGQSGTSAVTDGSVTFSKEYNVAVTSNATDSVIVCYSPRGFALGSGCSTGNLPRTVTFTAGTSSSTATVQALGMVEANP